MWRMLEWKLLLAVALYLIAAGLSAPGPAPAVTSVEAHAALPTPLLGPGPTTEPAPAAPPASPGVLGPVPLIHKP